MFCISFLNLNLFHLFQVVDKVRANGQRQTSGQRCLKLQKRDGNLKAVFYVDERTAMGVARWGWPEQWGGGWPEGWGVEIFIDFWKGWLKSKRGGQNRYGGGGEARGVAFATPQPPPPPPPPLWW